MSNDPKMTLRVVNTDGSRTVVEHVVPVPPLSMEKEVTHPGAGGRWRSSGLWVVTDGSGKTLGAHYYRRAAINQMREAQAVIDAHDRNAGA